MQYAVKGDDDVAVDETVSFNVVFCDKATIWLDMLMGLRESITDWGLRQSRMCEDRPQQGQWHW